MAQPSSVSSSKEFSSKDASSTNGKTQKNSTTKQKAPDKETILRAFRTMLRARLADLKTIVLYKQNKCHFQIGCAGHECIQAATAEVFKPAKDWFYPYYRDMALCAGLGMTDREFMLNAMNKEADPNSHGRQMPMHYGHKDLRIVNQSSPTGTQFLQAVGVALGANRKGLKEVVYVSAGEGTCSQGDFHEALSWASREKLPVAFVIQNNVYAISVHVSEQLGAKSVYDLTAGYENLGRWTVDGSDFPLSLETMEEAYEHALSGKGPALVEAHVPRLQSHSISDNHLKYRDEQDIQREQERDPLNKIRSLIITLKYATSEELDAIQLELKKAIDEAAEWAEAQADCDPKDATLYNYVDEDIAKAVIEREAQGEELYMVDALNKALHEEMKFNQDTFVFGQDVAHGKGGVFTVTTGLTDAFGVDRCFNAPLAEASIGGVAVGMATRGLKPIAEIQFGDYIWTAMMQIRNELAMMYYRSGGDFTCPAVIRVAVGGYIRGGVYHSQNIEATFSHFPGLYVVYPSNATDAKGLLKTAIRSKDPILFLEHKGLYRQVYAKGPDGGEDFLTPIGKAKVVRSGRDATIVTWGALVQKSLLAAKELEKDGVSVEVIDIRSIVPLDIECIFESVKKTNRVLIAHEDVGFMGFGAEIAAQIADTCFTSLDAPVKRVSMKYAAAVAHSPILEEALLPQTNDVTNGLRELLSF